MHVVSLTKPKSDDIAGGFEKLAERARAGDFISAVVFAFMPDKSFLTLEYGERLNRLEMIGMIETLKHDLLNAMDE